MIKVKVCFIFLEFEHDRILQRMVLPENGEILKGMFEIMRTKRNVQIVNGSKNVHLTGEKQNSQIPCASCSVSPDTVSGFREDVSWILLDLHEENICLPFPSNVNTCESTNILLSCMYGNLLRSISQINLSHPSASQDRFSRLITVYDHYKLLKSSLSLRLSDNESQQVYSCFLVDDERKQLKRDFVRTLEESLQSMDEFILQLCVAEIINKTYRKCVKTIITLDKGFNISNVVLGVYDSLPEFQGTETLFNMIEQFECNQQLNALDMLQEKLEKKKFARKRRGN